MGEAKIINIYNPASRHGRPGDIRAICGSNAARVFVRENRHALLHDDRNFAPMQEHLGLKVV